jgi:AraC family transcriptional regulator
MPVRKRSRNPAEEERMRTSFAATGVVGREQAATTIDSHNGQSHAQPLLSSRNRSWNGAVAELHRAREVDVLASFPQHTVTMHFTDGVDLVQRRDGRTRQMRVRAGDLLVTAAGEPKLLRHEQEAELLKVQLAPELVERVATESGLSNACGNLLKDNFGTRDPQLAHFCRQFRAELEQDGIGSRLYAESLAIQLALYLLRHYSTASPGDDVGAGRLPAHKLRRAIDYMSDRLDEELSLESIANELSMSVFHFAHLFKQTTGLSPYRYVIELRLERAKSLLRSTELPITEIAQQVGYCNNSHFAVAFHRATGVTPRDFRRNA